MIREAEQFKAADKEFSARHEAKQELESYVAQVETTINSPQLAGKIKKQQRSAIEAELAKSLERLEIQESSVDELKKAHLHLKRALQKATSQLSR